MSNYEEEEHWYKKLKDDYNKRYKKLKDYYNKKHTKEMYHTGSIDKTIKGCSNPMKRANELIKSVS